MDNEQVLKIILERFDKVDLQFKEVLNRLDKIEKSQQEDVKGTLHLISKKVDGIMYDVDYLSEKTGKHDTKINSLEKRIQS
ncbi:exotoxin beta-grasp domain-containing protein [Bacillus sp. FJAT-45350]|uniref:exotoxin beta-grasp domain-containing protein n=1 Tax=Bacillus sp. FJAT-45350 TaxID=2011014 RepID=UPI000BB8D689|nr:exotoxin beta-grasp domain-containing protein [Bacillus sp. FJAT-45350]